MFGTAAEIINAPYYLVSEWLSGEPDKDTGMYAEPGNMDAQAPSREMTAVAPNYNTTKAEAEVKRDVPTESNEAA